MDERESEKRRREEISIGLCWLWLDVTLLDLVATADSEKTLLPRPCRWSFHALRLPA